MPFNPLPLIVAGIGLLLVLAGWLLTRRAGAHVALGRRLAGARGVRVGDLLDPGETPRRPVRIAGRIRCLDPIVTSRDDRLVALHRDVEVRLPNGRWQTIERLRLTRGFELWDHDGSLPIDPALAAEPLVVLPHVWRGGVAELSDESHRAAIARLEAQHGSLSVARSTTRMVSVVERLLVLASVTRAPDGSPALEPPEGGYVISALELDDAMRLLGGARRRSLLAGIGLVAIGCGTLVLGSVLAIASVLG
ncbi:MAG TPA: hypothetical protein VF013_04305 [Candidatus Limnocylindria bacterium]